MSRRIRPPRRDSIAAGIAVLALAIATLVARSTPARAASNDVLAPYRALAGGPAGAALLAHARAAMVRHFDSAASDSIASKAPAWPGAPVGVFVSLLADGATRACVGRAIPLAGTLPATVTRLALEALGSDRRHPPVQADELASARIVIAFASPGEPVADPMSIQPVREGLLVESAHGSIAFLPGEARTVAWALREARRVGVLDHAAGAETARYSRFSVVTLAEPLPATPEESHEERDHGP